MPLLETKGAASAQGFGGAGAGASGPVTYIEDVFSTYLYTGNGSIQTIDNGIDLAGKGGLVWVKARNAAENNALWAYNLFGDQYLKSNKTDAIASSGLTYLSNGFRADAGFAYLNASSTTYASWTFRKQPKFFDVVTYTGTGANRTVSHSLGSVPGCIVVKRTDTTGAWQVYHRSLANTEYMVLNTTAAKATGTTRWNSTTPTSTVFSLGTDATVNASGGTYVAYLFAHDAGGFGLSGNENVISCGSFTTDGSGKATVNLGYEPQWVLFKDANSADSWTILDTMRGFNSNQSNLLWPNLSDAEVNAGANVATPTATGFQSLGGQFSPSSTVIYIAIRRGPMKVPTSGTSVYFPQAYADISLGTNNPTTLGASAGFPVDFFMHSIRSGTTFCANIFDRLRGSNPALLTSATDAEDTGEPLNGYSNAFDTMSGVKSAYNNRYYYYNSGAGTREHIGWFLRRAPSFFDEVCYTGTGATGTPALTLNHNLTVPPELIIYKKRSSGSSWWTFTSAIQPNPQYYYGALESSNAFTNVGANVWQLSTATQLFVPDYFGLNDSGQTYVAYLFATCAGVSKVGSYTGTGALQTINCGFTGGARFVLIKRTDSTGDWYVYDSARGISSGNDPYLLLNSTAAEVTGTNYVDTTSVGFQVTAAAPAGLNANGGTYIFLAIA